MRKVFFIVIFSVITMYGCAGQLPENGGGGEPLVQCGDVASREHLNVLTINLLFSEIQTRDQRLDSIAEFAAGTPVVFNTLSDPSQPTVSEHAGVFISVELS